MAVRGQPAALPPLHWRNDPGHRSTSGLVVRPVGEDGSSLGVYDFASLPLTQQLTEAFAAAFDRHCGPGARARRQATCYSVFSALGRYARFLAAMDPPPKTVSDLRPASWDAYVLARGRSAGAHGELSNLRGFLPGVTGLPSETRRVLARRLGKRPESEESAYSRGEFLRVRAAASHDVRALLRRIRRRTHAPGPVARGRVRRGLRRVVCRRDPRRPHARRRG